MQNLPLHLLTARQTLYWKLCRIQPQLASTRAAIGANFARLYPTGCGILEFGRLRLVAIVNPKGQIRDLRPPYREFHRADIANKPTPLHCACANFSHAEYGAWRNHPNAAQGWHHPLCQFDKTSLTVFNNVLAKVTSGDPYVTVATDETGNLYIPKEERRRFQEVRPDEADRERERVMGVRNAKSGARSG